MTSGTTGTPKLPAHTHQHVVAHLRAAGKAARVDRGATSLLALPFVTADDTDDIQLLEYCRAGLANYKVPARIVIVGELPAVDGANGTKLMRSTLRRAADLFLTDPA
jgi:acyl-coenzyme A synthetase/AMP-(fatty) acid ligase